MNGLQVTEEDLSIRRRRVRTAALDQHVLAPYGKAFIEVVLDAMNLKSDAALARAFGTTAPVISKVRNGRTPISDALIICAHEATGLSIRELKSYLPPSDRRSFLKIN